MTIMFTSGVKHFLAKLEVNPDLIHQMEANKDWSPSLGFQALYIVKAGQLVSKISFPANVNFLMGEDCSLEMRSKTRLMIEAEFSSLLKHCESTSKTVEGDIVPLEQALPKPEAMPTPFVEETVDIVLPLNDAEGMYQKVRGTSSDSVYFLIAKNSDLKVAARITSTQVSMRVEGTFSLDDREGLEKVGMSRKDGPGGKEYFSGHFKYEAAVVDPSRIVGAVLLGSGIKFVTPMPYVLPLVGLGG